MAKIDVAFFFTRTTLSLIVCISLYEVYGFPNENMFKPKFGSLRDLQDLKLIELEGKDPDLSKWSQSSHYGLSNHISDPYHRADIEEDLRRLSQGSPNQKRKFEKENGVIEDKVFKDILKNRMAKEQTPSSPTEEKITPFPMSQYWSKRDTEGGGGEKIQILSESSAAPYAKDDEYLANLQPNSECTKKLSLCPKLPFQQIDCILDCYLNQALANPKTKFLYRLLHSFKSFAQYLCPSFGTVYDEIPTLFEKGFPDNDLATFLQSMGLGESIAPVHIDFIKNFPQATFNNLVKYASGEEFDLLKPIVGTAQASAKAALSERNIFSSLYSNPSCKKSPEKGWITSMVDSMQQHPVLSDILLRGYWMMTRSLNIEMPYPLDGLFSSWIVGLKSLIGVECSIIPYAEQGKPFKCLQTSQLQPVLDAYKAEAAAKEDALSWLVCGAHQIDIPDWLKEKIKKYKDIGTNGTETEEPAKGDGDRDKLNYNQFPIPDEYDALVGDHFETWWE